MMGYFAPEFVSEVAERFGEYLGGRIGQFLILLLFFLLGFFLLNLLDL